MTRDPVVREVRDARERHAARFRHDLKAIFADLKRTERSRGVRGATIVAPPSNAEVQPIEGLRGVRSFRDGGARAGTRGSAAGRLVVQVPDDPEPLERQ